MAFQKVLKDLNDHLLHLLEGDTLCQAGYTLGSELNYTADTVLFSLDEMR